MSIDANFLIETMPLIEDDKHIFWKCIFIPPNRPEIEEGPEWDAWANARVWSNEPVTILPANATMFDVLAQAGIFSSKSDARKNWKGVVEIPWGWSEFTVGKLKHQVFIMKPFDIENPPPMPLPNSRVENKRIDNVT